MSKRKTDDFDDVHFTSDRFFYANNKWYYYVRSYDSDVHTIGGFNSKEDAMNNCEERFLNKIDYFLYKGMNK